MQKVFYNLISNAFKFTSFQGSVTIKVLESDKDVSVSVTDSGIGYFSGTYRQNFRSFLSGRQWNASQ